MVPRSHRTQSHSSLQQDVEKPYFLKEHYRAAPPTSWPDQPQTIISMEQHSTPIGQGLGGTGLKAWLWWELGAHWSDLSTLCFTAPVVCRKEICSCLVIGKKRIPSWNGNLLSVVRVGGVWNPRSCCMEWVKKGWELPEQNTCYIGPFKTTRRLLCVGNSSKFTLVKSALMWTLRKGVVLFSGLKIRLACFKGAGNAVFFWKTQLLKKMVFLCIKSVLIALSYNLQHLLGVMVAQFVLATGWFFTISLHRYFLWLFLGTWLF